VKGILYKVIFVLLLAYSGVSYANSVKVKIASSEIIKNEPFTVSFEIESDSNKSPNISFRPVNIEVLSKNRAGLSTSTTYVNGKISVRKIISYNYELVAKFEGRASLKDIKVVVGQNTLTHKDVNIIVKQTASKPRSHFILPIASNSEPYVGESVVVRYYIYSTTEVHKSEIKKFPDFKNVIKRYHAENKPAEIVEYKGGRYKRELLYTAQIYPMKEGVLKIPSASFVIVYPRSNRGSGFPFGLNFSSLTSKTLTSKTFKLNVKPLPPLSGEAINTGLVGKHSIDFNFGKNKYFVNEPIEMKLKISGKGALENFKAPSILNGDQIEEFDINSDLEIKRDFSATRTFNYSYLGRENFKRGQTSLKLAFLDPQSGKYVIEELIIPPIEIRGGGLQKSGMKVSQNNTEAPNDLESEDVSGGVLGPVIFTFDSKVINTINYILISLVLLLSLLVIRPFLDDLISKIPTEARESLNALKKGKYNFHDIYMVLKCASHDPGLTVKELIDKLDVAKTTKDKIKVLLENDGKVFSSDLERSSKISLGTKELKELTGLIKKNASSKKSQRSKSISWREF
jgi:hypothetical protein